MGFSMEEFAPLFMTSQLAGVFDVSFAAANGMENDELSNLLRIPMLLKSPEVIVEALYWIDDIVSKAEDDQNKSLLLSQAYEAERLRLPPALAELPKNPIEMWTSCPTPIGWAIFTAVNACSTKSPAGWYMGAFEEPIMHRAYQELLRSPLGEGNLIDSAVEICMELDRLLVEKIWPEKSKRQRQLQVKELERPAQPKIEGSMTNATGSV